MDDDEETTITLTKAELEALRTVLDEGDIFEYINWKDTSCPYWTVYDKISDEPAMTYRDKDED
jgi:hypothetical protein